LIKRTRISSLEKKPTKGGTPAIEKRDSETRVQKKEFALRSTKENIDLLEVEINCLRVQKIERIEEL
jgi:hypothetical protein